MTIEIKSAIEKIGTQFEEFKKHNDARLAEIEKKGHADPLLEEKVDKISESLNQLEDIKLELEAAIKKFSVPSASSSNQPSAHRSAFKKYLIDGDGDYRLKDELRSLGKKAYSGLTPASGGYFVPTEMDAAMLSLLKPVSAVRQLVSSTTIGTAEWTKRINEHGTNSGWVGSESERPKTSGSTVKLLRATLGTLYAYPEAPQSLLEDSAIDMEQWIIDEASLEFAKQEPIAFVTGDGVDKPRGFLNYPTAATGDDTRAYGTVEHVATGASGAFATTNPQDVLIDLQDKFDDSMLEGATWVMSGRTLSTIRKFKDENKQYLFQPGLSAGEPTTLLGFPISRIAVMPTIAANSLSIAFGNFKRAYLILDRIGVSVVRDDITHKGFVGFYTYKRVGGVLVDTQAIKVIKFAAS